MSKIANRIFNDTLSMDDNVKKRLQEIQDLSGGVLDSVSAADAQLNKDRHTFGGTGYLSGKTPFVRLWTAVRVTREQDTENSIPVDDSILNYPFDFVNNTYEYPKTIVPGEYGDTEIKEIPLEKFPESGYKVYQLGMNPSGERNIFSPQQGDTEITTLGNTLLPSQRNTYTDESYTGGRKNLRPPAGITNLTSTTQNSAGPVAGILKTTVEFSVYDFEEFDLIYSKYFLRPGAKVFVDFGYTDDKTFQLYDPAEYIQDPETFNEKIYGQGGQLQNSKYGMQFIQGQVTKFSANLDTATQAYKCSLDISSKNMQIFDVNMDDDIIGNVKKGILSNIEFRILDMAENALFPDRKDLLNPSSLEGDEVKEHTDIADIFAAEMLSAQVNNVPTQLNVELGVFWKGSFVKDKQDDKKKVPQTGNDAIYLSYGFIEDVLLNEELGKYGKASDQFLGGDAIEFDTSESYTTWTQELFDRQRFLKTNSKLPFLFPENWDETYNTRKDKSPTGFKETGDDKTKNRIPIREVFIKLAVFKSAIKSAETVTEVFNYIFKQMAESTGYHWDWGLNSTDLQNNRLGIIDRNYTAKEIINNNAVRQEITGEDFFNDMFMFEPFSPTTIVKSMNLNLSPGDGSAISSKLALQSLGKAGRSIFATSEIIDQTQTQMVIEDLQDDGTYKSIYNVEFYPPAEGGSDLEKIFKSFESEDKAPTADEKFLSAENIYGGEETKFTTIPGNTKSYINATQEILDKKGQRGDKSPASKPTIEQKQHRAVLENANYEFCDTVYEYYTKKHLVFTLPNKPTILPTKLSLTIHGFTGLQPSDKFRINHIPTRYSNFIFFQIMKITHSVIPGGFNTDLECVMRVRDDVKKQLPLNNQKINVLKPELLKSGHKLREVGNILPFGSYMDPNLDIVEKINAALEGKNKSYKFEKEMVPIEYCYNFHTLPTGGGAANHITTTIESTFTIKTTEDEEASGAKEFESRLDYYFNKLPNAEIVKDTTDELRTYRIKYTFEPDTKYLVFVSEGKFLVTHATKSTLPEEDITLFFKRASSSAEVK